LFSQESKLKFHNISFSFPSIYIDNNTGGLAFSLDIGMKKEKHIYKLVAVTGSEYNTSLLGPSKQKDFYEVSILYGRELFFKKYLSFDFYGGLGLFNQTITIPVAIPGTGGSCGFGGFCINIPDYDYIRNKSKTIGLSLQSKIRFKTSKRFSLGIQLHTNINSVNTIYSSGIFFQWEFKGIKNKSFNP
jgi:hypothetical protein